jgi:hypothetical protein
MSHCAPFRVLAPLTVLAVLACQGPPADAPGDGNG